MIKPVSGTLCEISFWRHFYIRTGNSCLASNIWV